MKQNDAYVMKIILIIVLTLSILTVIYLNVKIAFEIR